MSFQCQQTYYPILQFTTTVFLREIFLNVKNNLSLLLQVLRRDEDVDWQIKLGLHTKLFWFSVFAIELAFTSLLDGFFQRSFSFGQTLEVEGSVFKYCFFKVFFFNVITFWFLLLFSFILNFSIFMICYFNVLIKVSVKVWCWRHPSR